MIFGLYVHVSPFTERLQTWSVLKIFFPVSALSQTHNYKKKKNSTDLSEPLIGIMFSTAKSFSFKMFGKSLEW